MSGLGQIAFYGESGTGNSIASQHTRGPRRSRAKDPHRRVRPTAIKCLVRSIRIRIRNAIGDDGDEPWASARDFRGRELGRCAKDPARPGPPIRFREVPEVAECDFAS